MDIKTKHIEIHSYNPNWPKVFEKEAASIKQVLGKHCVEIHHIGSTAIPGLKAKQDIDILCVIDSLSSSLKLKDIGYVFKGELNIPLRNYFSKNTSYSKVNLHVVERDHGFIQLNLTFRDYLRSHEGARLSYIQLKENLLSDPKSYQRTGRFANYTYGKAQFIMNILEKAGFSEFTVNFCMHKDEWEAYHRIRDEQIYRPIGVIYDRNHPTITAENHFHFVLRKGIKIVTVGHLEFLNEQEAALRSLATDEPYKRNGYGKQLMRILEKWLKYHDRRVLKLHSNLNAENFYRSLGYLEMLFDDPCINEFYVDLGKEL